MKRLLVALLVAGCDIAPRAPAPPPAAKPAPAPAPAPTAKPAATPPGATATAPAAPPAPLTPEERKRAEAAIDDTCQICHGIDLVETQRLGRGAWEKTVKKMVDWGAPVTPERVGAITTVLSERYGAEAAPVPPTLIDPKEALAQVATDEPRGGDAVHGATQYAALCASCHGAKGAGGPLGPGLTGRHVVHRAKDFAAVIRSGRRRMPKLDLDDKSITDLLAFLRSNPS